MDKKRILVVLFSGILVLTGSGVSYAETTENFYTEDTGVSETISEGFPDETPDWPLTEMGSGTSVESTGEISEDLTDEIPAAESQIGDTGASDFEKVFPADLDDDLLLSGEENFSDLTSDFDMSETEDFASGVDGTEANPDTAGIFTAQLEEECLDLLPLEDADPEELFEKYVDRELSAPSQKTGALRARKVSGGSLTGIDRKLYLALSTRLANIAAGNASSTEFSIPVSEIGLDQPWTAQELGVNSLISGNSISPVASKAFQKKVFGGFDQVLNQLLVDMPYDLYWFDKTDPEAVMYSGAGIQAAYDLNKDDWALSCTGNMTYSFTVAKDYRKNGESHAVDPSIGQSVQKARTTISQIVSRYASGSDYEKLLGYKNEICELTSYNFEALSSDPYGNPWQLIWVFDGDPATKVVCEGYSKAFQHLCDLTKFRNSIVCSTVTGIMRTPNSSGAHMWNIVRMEDGKTYLADVTNSDDVAADRQPFLVGYYYGNVSSGYAFRNAGETVSYTYDDDTKSIFTTAQLTIAPTNYLSGESTVCTHTHIATWQGKAATCLEEGLTEEQLCTDCGKILKEQKLLPALGHSWSAWKTTAAPTALSAGLRSRTCSRCKAAERQYIEKLKPTYQLNASSIILKVGQSTKKVKITGLAKGDSIRNWKSANKKIATVTSKGVIKGVKTGRTTITATLASGVKVSIKVKVQKGEVATTSITGIAKKETLKKGKTLKLKPVLLPITSVQKITYRSSNTKVATVSAKGVIKARKKGKTVITIIAGKKKVKCTVTVK